MIPLLLILARLPLPDDVDRPTLPVLPPLLDIEVVILLSRRLPTLKDILLTSRARTDAVPPILTKAAPTKSGALPRSLSYDPRQVVSLLPRPPATLHPRYINVSFNLVISLLCVHLLELKFDRGPRWPNRLLVFAERITLRNVALHYDLLLPNRDPLGTATRPWETEQNVPLRRLTPTG